MKDRGALSRVPTHVHLLDNGLTVVVREDRSAPVVAIVTRVGVGYLDEPDDVTGISHVLEHMFFKGTPSRGPGELSRETRAAGGILNAATSYERTLYHTVLPSSSLEQGIALQSDALLHARIDGDELARELRVIIQEAKRKLDSPHAVAQETLYETMFDAHRLRRWRVGTEAGLARLTRDDVFAWYRRTYRPDRIVLSIAGDVDVAHVLPLIQRSYGGLDADGDAPPPGPQEPERTGFRFRESGGDVQRAYIEWGWRTPGLLHDDTAALDVLAVVHGQGRASRLYRGVRDTGLASEVGARNGTQQEIGVYGASSVTQPGSVIETLKAMAPLLNGARDLELREAEIERAKRITEARILRILETAQGQATLAAEWQAMGDWRLAETYLDRVLATRIDDVERVAARWLAPDSATVYVYRPAHTPVDWAADRLRETLFNGSASPLPVSSVTHVAPATSRRAQRVECAPVEDDVHSCTIGESAHIVIQPRHASPLVTIGIVFRGGSNEELATESGWTGLMARTALRGTHRRDAVGIAEAAESLGGSITPSVDADAFDWAIAVPSRHLRASLELLADVVFEPTFDAAQVETERKAALARLVELRDDMVGYPLRLALETAFAGHTYGHTIEETEAATGAVTADALRLRHASLVANGEPWLFVAGDIDPDEVVALAARVLAVRADGAKAHAGSGWFRAGQEVRADTGSFRAGQTAGAGEGSERADAAAAEAARWPAHARERTVERQTAQSAIAIAFPGPTRNDPDALALRVFAHAIGGGGGALFEELRSRRSLAYSVSAFPMARQLGGAFIGYIATSPERAAEAHSGLIGELARLAAEPLAETDLERARRFTIGARQIQTQTNSARLGLLAGALMLGRGLDEIRDFDERVYALTPSSVRDAAARWIDPARVVTGLVRGTGGSR